MVIIFKMKKDSFIPLAERVMEKLMEHPCARPFMIPLIPGKTCPQNYTQYVKNPIDLTTIKKQLKEKKYRNFKEWYNAVDLIWSNSRAYYEEDDLMIPVTDEIEAIFENELQKQQLRSNVDEWWKEVRRLKEKIGKLNSNPPEKTIYSFTGFNPSRKFATQLYTTKEVKQFISAVKLMKDPDNHEELIKIVGDMQPELKSSGNIVNVDIYKLHPTTFNAAKEYVQKTLKSQEIDYPK